MWNNAPVFELTRHATHRQAERNIPSCLLRLALEKGARLVRADSILVVLTVGQLDAAGFGPSTRGLELVVRGDRVVTAYWIDGGAR